MTNKPTVPDLKELFKQASEIAAQVPENMQEAAFNRALDLLTHSHQDLATNQVEKDRKLPPKIKTLGKRENKDQNNIYSVLSSVDTTQHPGIKAATKVLDRALMVLQIARTEFHIDGLSNTDIAKVLTEKFRIRTSKNAVGMALSGATDLVNRNKQGIKYIYQIMGPGEDHLAHIGDPSISDRPIPSKKKTTKSAKSKSSRKDATATTKSKKTSGARRVGPKKVLESLISEGYFSKPRQIAEIIEHIQYKKAVKFKATDMSPALVRLLREEKLERTKNESGSYQYVTKF